MKNRTPVRRHCRWRLCLAALSLITLAMAILPALNAQQFVTVRVSILWTFWPDCDDGVWGPPQIYFNVTIDEVSQSSKGHDDWYFNIAACLSPPLDPMPGWTKEFSLPDVDLAKGSIPIVIEAWDNDEDDPLGGDDDPCPIGPNGDFINLSLDLATGRVTGDATGDIGVQLMVERTCLIFMVEVLDPPRTPGLNVRCLHRSIWPQPGEAVTITAEALDGQAGLIPGRVDNIEIWIDGALYRSTAVDGPGGANTLTATYTPPAGATQISYGCRVFDDGEHVFTGWRVVQIGQPAYGRAVPIVYTGPRASRIDIAFVPDRDDFAGPNDPVFLRWVYDAIWNGYYAGDEMCRGAGRVFLGNQDMLNFWVALDMGDVGEDAHGTKFLHPPAGWDDDYNFVDAGALLHSNAGFQDFALRGKRMFSSDDLCWVLLHECGHQPFGLSDEYCENGPNATGYFVPDPYPNVYRNQEDCLNDPLADGVADACQQVQAPGCEVNYYRVESAATFGDDLMVGLNDQAPNSTLTPNAADARRINWLFNLCRGASCE